MEQASGIKSKAVSGALWKFLERMSAQLVSMAVAIILARLLEPDDYSVVSIVNIFFTFANIFISGGFNSALIQKKDADIEDYSSAFFLSVGVSVLLYGIMFAAAPIAAVVYGRPALISVIRVMGLILPINAVKSIVCAYISSQMQFRKFFVATMGGTVLSCFVGVGMAYAGCGHWALVAQQMTNTTMDVVILLLTTRVPLAAKVSLKKLKRLFSYGSKVFASSVIDIVYIELNPLFIGIKYSGTDLTFYSKGKSFPSLLSSICNNTLSAVLFPLLSKFQDDPKELIRCTRRFVQTSTFIIFPAMCGFFAISDNFVELLLTEKWLPVAHYIRVFCLKEMVVSIEAGNRETLKAIGRSDIFLKYEIIKKVCFFTIIGSAMVIADSPMTLAYSAIGCSAVVAVVSFATNARILGYGIREQLGDILKNLVCALVMCAAVRLIRLDGMPLIAELMIQLLTGVVVYLCACLLVRNKNLQYLWSKACSMVRRSAAGGR